MDKRLIKDMLTSLSLTMEQIIKVNNLTINRGCVDGSIIGNGRSDYTRESTVYELLIQNRKFALIDIPGIEGDESLFEDVIKQSLEKAHIIFYVNGSGKKIEKESLTKIKKYMHDGTSVYAVFNVHCKPKKDRIPGIDLQYSEELDEAYLKEKDIIKQTEDELVSFLGKNYKGYLDINGLLAFCSLALDDKNKTTIKNEDNKNLRGDQIKYLKEYKMDRRRMLQESHFSSICKVIEEKVDRFENDICVENLKKLSNRLIEMIGKITCIKEQEERRIKGFVDIYNEFEKNCYNAKEDFIRTMRLVGHNAATEAFDELTNLLFDRIESDEGDTTGEAIQEIVNNHKEQLVSDIENGINTKIEKTQSTFKDAIQDAQERMEKDFERNQIQFEISLTSDSISIDSAFLDALKYSMKDFGKHALTIGSLALSGAFLGSIIPGLGSIIGGIIGGVVGLFSSIWNFFISKDRKINNAKGKIKQAIDENIDVISDRINEELKKLSYEDKINDVYNALCAEADKQKEMLAQVMTIIYDVEYEMKGVLNRIA